MFTIITNYKRMFSSFIKNDLENPENIQAEDFKGDELEDLKILQKALKDGKIDSTEATIIKEALDDIEGEAKNGLAEIANKMLIEGFSAIDENSYNSFKKLIEGVNQNSKVPKWDTIMQTTLDNLSSLSVTYKGLFTKSFNEGAFHGVSIKGDTIKVRYDGLGENDTLKIKYNPNNSEILKGEKPEWIEEGGENNDFNNKSEMDLSSMDDNIKDLEQDREIELNKQKIATETNRAKAAETVNADAIKKNTSKINENTNFIEQEKTKVEDKAKKVIEKKEINRKNKESIKWNKTEFTTNGIRLIQSKLGFTKGNGLDGDFGPKTLAKIKEKGINDGKIGLGALKKLGLVDKNNNAINGLTKDMFNSGQLEKGNSSRIKFKESPKENKAYINNSAEVKNNVSIPEYIANKTYSIEHALAHLEEGVKPKKGNSSKFIIGKYNDSLGNKHNIIVYKLFGDVKVEIDDTGFDDIDKKVGKYGEVNKEDVQKTVQKLIEEHKKEFNKEELDAMKILGLSEKDIKELSKLGITFEEKNDEEIYRLDRKGLGSNDFFIKRNENGLSIGDGNKIIKLDKIRQSDLVESLKQTDTLLKLLDDADDTIESINNKLNDSLMQYDVSQKEKDFKKYIENFDKPLNNISTIKSQINTIKTMQFNLNK